MTKYVVSRDSKSGLWYVHKEGYPYVPVFGSLGTKGHAMSVAKLYNRTRGMA